MKIHIYWTRQDFVICTEDKVEDAEQTIRTLLQHNNPAETKVGVWDTDDKQVAMFLQDYRK
jgi:hypothetical protein